MNERIQELKIQACKWASENAPMSEYENACDEKFAELIVRACQLVINNIDATDASMTRGLYHAEYSIGKHFGVTE